MLDTNTEHIQPSGEPCPSPARLSHLPGAVTGSSKGHSAILLSQLLQDGGKYGKISESTSLGPLLYFICREVRSLTQSNSVCISGWWTTHSVSSWIVVLAEALHAGKENS